MAVPNVAQAEETGEIPTIWVQETCVIDEEVVDESLVAEEMPAETVAPTYCPVDTMATEELYGATDFGFDTNPFGSIYTTRSAHWTRLWGKTSLDTMRAIVQADGVFASGRGGSVVIATADGFRDALTATGLAGVLDAPVLITPKNSLASQTKAELQRLNPVQVVVVGGEAAISASTYRAIESTCTRAKANNSIMRVWGNTGVATAEAVYRCVKDYWEFDYAYVATSNNYKDALAIAPQCYRRKAPIFLTQPNKSVSGRILTQSTIKCIKEGNFGSGVITLGGDKAVPTTVEGQLRNNGISAYRLSGRTATITAACIAKWEIDCGMTRAHRAVATTSNYKDALCGAALAGKQNSVLVLVNKTGFDKGVFSYWDDNQNNYVVGYDAVFDQESVEHGHILGGTSAISASLWGSLTGTYFIKAPCSYRVSGGTYNGWTLNFYTDGSMGAKGPGSSKETKFGQWFATSNPDVTCLFDNGRYNIYPDYEDYGAFKTVIFAGGTAYRL